MKNENDKTKETNSKDEFNMSNEKRIEELLNINNRYVRTQRHLEENSDIASEDRIEHAHDIQNDRENRMEHLKNIITMEDNNQENEAENLKKRIEYTDGYLEHNKDEMNSRSFENAVKKQRHRKEQLENLKD